MLTDCKLFAIHSSGEKMTGSRRYFLKKIALGAIATSLPMSGYNCKNKKKINVLFLFADDQRFDTINKLGNNKIKTPHLDKLAENGVSYTNAYIMGGNSGAVCMPSRAMLLTGRTQFHLKDSGQSIPDSHIMMPELFRQNGYTTFGTGKWHNGKQEYARCFNAGGEIMFGGMSDHWNVPCYEFDPLGKYDKQTPVIEDPWNSSEITLKNYDHITEGKHSSELFADEAIGFLHHYQDDKPFFMYVAFTAPHDPRSVPKNFLELYDPEDIDLPENFLPQHSFDNGELNIRDEKLAALPRTPQTIKKHIAAYYAMITHLDVQIGRIKQALEDIGELDNTLIIFSADNGLAVGQHGLLGKQNLYEHSIRVPLLFSGPGIPKNEKRGTLCYLLDIYPTLCQYLNITCPASIDGKSFLKSIHSKEYSHRKEVIFGYKNFQKGIRQGDWKLIQYNVKNIKTTQLFNLQKDPKETINLAYEKDHKKLVAKLTNRLQELLAKAGDIVDLDKSDWGIKNNSL